MLVRIQVTPSEDTAWPVLVAHLQIGRDRTSDHEEDTLEGEPAASEPTEEDFRANANRRDAA